jgi:hypothetical protein
MGSKANDVEMEIRQQTQIRTTQHTPAPHDFNRGRPHAHKHVDKQNPFENDDNILQRISSSI